LKQYIRRTTLTLAVIFLFISTAILPSSSLHSNITSDNTKLVRITTIFYDTAEASKQGLWVTNQNTRAIQQIFSDLKNQLALADSLRETHRIFNDTIDALALHRLLPSDISIQQLKTIVTHASHYQKQAWIIRQMNTQHPDIANTGEINNYFCSIAGNSSNTHVAKLAKRIAHRLYVIMDHHTENALLVKLATAFWVVFNQISKITQEIIQQNGTHYGVSIYYGNYHYYPYPDWLHPAEGWVSTNSITGKQNLTGTFWGQTIAGGWQPQDDWYMNYTWRGCLGFSGVLMYMGDDTVYYLGSALHVHIGSTRP
jgi:hypothetical protein